jgi:Holliday junction resolvase RusA-like endonuclease
MRYELAVPGTPVPKARPRVVNRGGKVRTFTPDTTARWEDMIRWAVMQNRPERLLTGPLAAELTFFLPRPKSIPKSRQFPEVKPDWDNLGKAVTDALEGLLFENDSRLVRVLVTKVYGDPPRAAIVISELE